MRVYVKNMRGEALMPTTPRKARVLQRISVVLDKIPKRIVCYIDHWIDVSYLVFKHIDHAITEMIVSMEYYIHAASLDISYDIAMIGYHLYGIMHGYDIDSSSCAVWFTQSVMMESMDYQSNKLTLLYELFIKAQSSDIDISSLSVKYIFPVLLKDYTFSIGDSSVLLQDWCYTEI